MKKTISALVEELNNRSDPFFTPALLSYKRIGPHRFEVLSFLFCCLIGDQHREYRFGSTRVTFHYTSKNVAYLYWLHKYLRQFGYCNQKAPSKLTKQLVKGTLHHSMKFHTWQFQSFNFIREVWYDQNGTKVIPDILEMFLTPLGFAILLQDDQSYTENGGILIQTHGYGDHCCQKLLLMLERKFVLTQNFRSTKKGPCIFFKKDQVPKIIDLTLPYFSDSMLYKLGLTVEQKKRILQNHS